MPQPWEGPSPPSQPKAQGAPGAPTRRHRRTDLAIGAKLALVALVGVAAPVLAQSAPPAAVSEPKPLEPLGHASMVLLDIAIPIAVIHGQLESAVPRSESGSRPDPVGNPVVDDVVEWNSTRGDLQVSSSAGAIRAATTIGGTARIRGNVRLIRGDIGKLLGKLNPTNIPFSAHADLRASVTAETRPQLLPAWRLQPQFSASARVEEAKIPITNVGDISVRGHVQRAIDDKLAALRDQLEGKLGADDRIEREARKAWDRLCQAFALDPDKDGRPDLYLRVTPTVARASQPRIDETGLFLQVGIEANTEISEDGEKPDCPFPAVLQLLPTENARFDIALPVDLTYETINRVAAAQMPATIKRPDQGIEALFRSVKIAATQDDRLLVTIDGSFSENRWLFGKTVEGTFVVRARPKLDLSRNAIGFEAVDLDIKSRQMFGLTELLAKGAAPLIEQWVASSLAIDVRREAERLPLLAAAAIAAFNQKTDGVEVQARFDQPKLVGLDFDAAKVRLIGEAHGQVSVAVR